MNKSYLISSSYIVVLQLQAKGWLVNFYHSTPLLFFVATDNDLSNNEALQFKKLFLS